jgi:hypothetical protein
LQSGDDFVTVGVDIKQARKKKRKTDSKDSGNQRQDPGKLDVGSYLHRDSKCLGIGEFTRG